MANDFLIQDVSFSDVGAMLIQNSDTAAPVVRSYSSPRFCCCHRITESRPAAPCRMIKKNKIFEALGKAPHTKASKNRKLTKGNKREEGRSLPVPKLRPEPGYEVWTNCPEGTAPPGLPKKTMLKILIVKQKGGHRQNEKEKLIMLMIAMSRNSQRGR